MSEMAINIPIAANDNSAPKGELDAHFESQIEADKQDTLDLKFEYKNWMQRMQMTPEELSNYIISLRGYISEEIKKTA